MRVRWTARESRPPAVSLCDLGAVRGHVGRFRDLAPSAAAGLAAFAAGGPGFILGPLVGRALSWAARPPLAAISRCFSRDIEAKPLRVLGSDISLWTVVGVWSVITFASIVGRVSILTGTTAASMSMPQQCFCRRSFQVANGC